MAFDRGGVFSEFQTKGQGSWKPLRLRKTGWPLRDTRTLERSIGWKVVGKNEVVVGTNLKYSRVHQYGATIRAKTPKGLRFIAEGEKFEFTPTYHFSSGKKVWPKRGASVRRTGRGKVPKGMRWYRLMQVTIPRRRFLIWRPAQLRVIIERAAKYIATGQIPPAGMSGGGGSSTLKRNR